MQYRALPIHTLAHIICSAICVSAHLVAVFCCLLNLKIKTVAAGNLRRGTVWTCQFGTAWYWRGSDMKMDLDLLKSTIQDRNRNILGIWHTSFIHPLSTHSYDLSWPDRLTFIFLSNSNTCSSFTVTHRGNMSKTAPVVPVWQAGSLLIVQQHQI